MSSKELLKERNKAWKKYLQLDKIVNNAIKNRDDFYKKYFIYEDNKYRNSIIYALDNKISANYKKR